MIKVMHRDFDRDGMKDGMIHVANVDTDNLELAWRLTNNIKGSWSHAEVVDGVENPDYSPLVEVVEPLMVKNGKTYGHRSSMVGDVFVTDSGSFKVAIFGFDKV